MDFDSESHLPTPKHTFWLYWVVTAPLTAVMLVAFFGYVIHVRLKYLRDQEKAHKKKPASRKTPAYKKTPAHKNKKTLAHREKPADEERPADEEGPVDEERPSFEERPSLEERPATRKGRLQSLFLSSSVRPNHVDSVSQDRRGG
jgi:hypothetical protein